MIRNPSNLQIDRGFANSQLRILKEELKLGGKQEGVRTVESIGVAYNCVISYGIEVVNCFESAETVKERETSKIDVLAEVVAGKLDYDPEVTWSKRVPVGSFFRINALNRDDQLIQATLISVPKNLTKMLVVGKFPVSGMVRPVDIRYKAKKFDGFTEVYLPGGPGSEDGSTGGFCFGTLFNLRISLSKVRGFVLGSKFSEQTRLWKLSGFSFGGKDGSGCKGELQKLSGFALGGKRSLSVTQSLGGICFGGKGALGAATGIGGTVFSGNVFLTKTANSGFIVSGECTYTVEGLTGFVFGGVSLNGALLIEPVITWETPAAIPYGELLSEDQLNATANVPGEMFYDKTEGDLFTVLESPVKLTCMFVPTDLTVYRDVEKSVWLEITPADPQLVFTLTAPFSGGLYRLEVGDTLAGKYDFDTLSNGNIIVHTQNLNNTWEVIDLDTYVFSVVHAFKKVVVAQAATTNYLPSAVLTKTFEIRKKAVSPVLTADQVTVGWQMLGHFTVTNQYNATLKYSIQQPNGVWVSLATELALKTYTIHTAGQWRLQAYVDSTDPKYTGVSNAPYFTAIAAPVGTTPQTISCVISPGVLRVGTTTSLVLTSNGHGTGAVTYAIVYATPAGAATLAGTTLTGVYEGWIEVRISKAADALYAAATFSLGVFIEAAYVPPNNYLSPTFNIGSNQLSVGQTTPLTGFPDSRGSFYNFYTGSTAVAEVINGNTLIARGIGTTVVYMTQQGWGSYLTTTISQQVSVTNNPWRLVWSDFSANESLPTNVSWVEYTSNGYTVHFQSMFSIISLDGKWRLWCGSEFAYEVYINAGYQAGYGNGFPGTPVIPGTYLQQGLTDFYQLGLDIKNKFSGQVNFDLGRLPGQTEGMSYYIFQIYRR